MTQAEEKYYLKVEQRGLCINSRKAETSQALASSHGNWKVADERTCCSLDRLVHEVQLLKLHRNLVVEMTTTNQIFGPILKREL